MNNQSNATDTIHIRWMIRRDMAEVLEIEQQGFDFAWTEEDFLKCLRERNCIGQVAVDGDDVVGFLLYELAGSINVLKMAVHPSRRRQGIGRMMIGKLIGKLSQHRRNRISVAVRDDNLGGQLFFRAMGFRATRVLRGYWDDGGDAYKMQYRLMRNA